MSLLTTVLGGARSMIGASWFPYVAIGISAVSVFGFGYMKGYGSAETKMQAKINTALEVQLKEMKAIAKRDTEAALKTAEKEWRVGHDMDQIIFPDIAPHCYESLAEWMRAFNDGVRAADPGT